MDCFTPVQVTGARVALEPLGLRHLDDLAIAGADAAIWRWLPSAHHQPGTMCAFIDSAMMAQSKSNGASVCYCRPRFAEGGGLNALPSYRARAPQNGDRRHLDRNGAPAFARQYRGQASSALVRNRGFAVSPCIEFKADVDNAGSRAPQLRGLAQRGEGVFQQSYALWAIQAATVTMSTFPSLTTIGRPCARVWKADSGYRKVTAPTYGEEVALR